MEHHTTTSRAEAERLLGIAEKLLRNKDFTSSRDFAILAQETEPLLEGADQILAVAEVLFASEHKRLNNNQPDWYSILQIPQRTDEVELIKKQYRRLALLLHPDKNKFPFSDSAFRLVADSWAVLSDPAKKAVYDNEFVARFTKVDLVALKKQQNQFQQQMKQQNKDDDSQQKLPVRRSGRGSGGGDGVGSGSGSGGGAGGAASASGGGIKVNKKSNSGDFGLPGNFWTACPYCYNLYEYSRVYDGCCLRCDNENCKRAFTATEILSMPPVVPGKEAYYCCWGFFPMGFVAGNVEGGKNGFPKWMPPMFADGGTAEAEHGGAAPVSAPPPPPPVNVTPVSAAPPPPPENVTPVSAAAAPAAETSTAKKKRGRPRKNL